MQLNGGARCVRDFKDLCVIPMGRLAFAAVAAGTVLATSAFAQSAREIRGPTPYVTIENEPAPKLIVDPPLPGPLARASSRIQYRVENVRIVPVFGGAPSTYLHGSGICT